MLKRFFIHICMVVLAASTCSCSSSMKVGLESLDNAKWIDLSHDFGEGTISWPNSEKFVKETVFEGQTKQGYYYEAYNFATAEHSGTHVDAPIHFARGKRSIDQVPLSQFIGEACVVDITLKIEQSASADYQITVDDILSWEENYGMIPDNAILLFMTGYSKFWDEPEKYLGTKLGGEKALKELHFPGLEPETAKWLVQNRKIKAIGIDTASIDYGQSRLFETHRILAAHNLIIFENLMNLDQLPGKGTLLIALPMKIRGGSGAPVRIIAKAN